MSEFVIGFMIVATFFALLTIGYVVIDIVVESRQRHKKLPEMKTETPPSSASHVSPKPTKAPDPVKPKKIDRINATIFIKD